MAVEEADVIVQWSPILKSHSILPPIYINKGHNMAMECSLSNGRGETRIPYDDFYILQNVRAKSPRHAMQRKLTRTICTRSKVRQFYGKL